jgi:RNA polymerase-interacting CarD/CdnL/TRCF family regulator
MLVTARRILVSELTVAMQLSPDAAEHSVDAVLA